MGLACPTDVNARARRMLLPHLNPRLLHGPQRLHTHLNATTDRTRGVSAAACAVSESCSGNVVLSTLRWSMRAL